MKEVLNFRPELTTERCGKKQPFSEPMVYFKDGSGYSVEMALKKGFITKDQVPSLKPQTLHNYAISVLKLFRKGLK